MSMGMNTHGASLKKRASGNSTGNGGFYIPGQSNKAGVRKTSHGAVLKRDRSGLDTLPNKPRIHTIGSTNSHASGNGKRATGFNNMVSGKKPSYVNSGSVKKLSNSFTQKKGDYINSSSRSFGSGRKVSTNSFGRKASANNGHNLLLPSYKKKKSFNMSSSRKISRNGSSNNSNSLLAPSFTKKKSSNVGFNKSNSFSRGAVSKADVVSSSKKPEVIKTQVSVKNLKKSLSASFENENKRNTNVSVASSRSFVKRKTSSNSFNRTNSANKDKFMGLQNKINSQNSFSRGADSSATSYKKKKKSSMVQPKKSLVVPKPPPSIPRSNSSRQPVKENIKSSLDSTSKQGLLGNLNSIIGGERKPPKPKQQEVEEVPLAQAPKLSLNLQAEIQKAGKGPNTAAKVKKKPSFAKPTPPTVKPSPPKNVPAVIPTPPKVAPAVRPTPPKFTPAIKPTPPKTAPDIRPTPPKSIPAVQPISTTAQEQPPIKKKSSRQGLIGSLNAIIGGGPKPRKAKQKEVEEVPLDQAPKLSLNLQAEIQKAGKGPKAAGAKVKKQKSKKPPKAAPRVNRAPPKAPTNTAPKPPTFTPPPLPNNSMERSAPPQTFAKPPLGQVSRANSKPPPVPSNPRPSTQKKPPALPSNPRPSTQAKPPGLSSNAGPSQKKKSESQQLPPSVRKMRMSEKQKKNLRASIKGLQNLASFWDDYGTKNKKKQELNPFSEHFNGKREVAKDNVLNSKSEERAQQAQQWTNKEIDRVVQVIKDFGAYDSSKKQTMITFGELFLIYEKISDTLVFMLIKAKKRGRLFFDAGEMLLQGRDDHVQIIVKH